MVIAVPSHTHIRMGSIYGHACLYIGNNQVMDNVGQIRTLDMAYWLDYYSTSYKPKWGWYDNVSLAWQIESRVFTQVLVDALI